MSATPEPIPRCAACPLDGGWCPAVAHPGLCRRASAEAAAGGPTPIRDALRSRRRLPIGDHAHAPAVATAPACRRHSSRWSCGGDLLHYCALGHGVAGVIDPGTDCAGCPDATG